MTVLTRWDPFREFATLQDRMNRLFQDSFGHEGRWESLSTSSFAPAIDVYEDEHNVTLKIEVPGIDEKDIDVRVENKTLTVHGERKYRFRKNAVQRLHQAQFLPNVEDSEFAEEFWHFVDQTGVFYLQKVAFDQSPYKQIGLNEAGHQAFNTYITS